jgi:hypothetical protein
MGKIYKIKRSNSLDKSVIDYRYKVKGELS